MIAWIFKKIFFTLCGMAGIFAFNSFGAGGFTIGFNLINGAIIGLLGLPGVLSVLGLNFIL